MYKLLGLDLDGTLLNSQHEISDTNKETIRLLYAKGVKVILLSGREPSSLKAFAEELGIKEPLSGLNGGIITDHTGEKVLYQKCIDEELAKKMVNYVCNENVVSFIFIGNMVLFHGGEAEELERAKAYILADIKPIKNISKYIGENNLWGKINKILLAGENQNLLKHREKLNDLTNGNLSMEFSLPIFLELFNKDVSKGRALAKIGEMLDIKGEEMVVIGDGENDISMIEYAGVGVAMENALSTVKNRADYITLSNDEDGVSHVIKKFWNI